MNVAEVSKLVAFVLPLGVDTFAVAAAVGAAGGGAAGRATGETGLRPELRRRMTALFVAFEAGMPLLGLALGAPLAHAVGDVAEYVAGAVLMAVGAWMFFGEDEDGEEQRARSFTNAHGLTLIALGLSISLDELAIGFTLGLSRLPVAAVIVAIAVQAAIAAQLGLRLGARLSERSREAAEKLAGVALVGLGIYLVIAQLGG
ncbi:MAG: hypothetical protein HOV83_37875 [Catenulispora sp.]|nr:hypothetical protein [Catenulispora sp.]